MVKASACYFLKVKGRRSSNKILFTYLSTYLDNVLRVSQ